MQLDGVTTSVAPQTSQAQTNALTELGSDDFLKLLITQLTNQDPLEPVGNAELLDQLSSVRDIELSTTLTKALNGLVGQNRVASSSSLIGKFVTAAVGNDGLTQSGVVTAVRFTQDGQPLLRLTDGSEVPLDQIASIEPAVRAAELLVGQTVVGVDRRQPGDATPVEGVVTSVREEGLNEVFLELDSGQDLRFRDVVGVKPTE